MEEERRETSAESLVGPDQPLEMINLHKTIQTVAFLYLYVCGFVPVGFFISLHMRRRVPPDVWKYLLPLCLLWLRADRFLLYDLMLSSLHSSAVSRIFCRVI